MAFAAASATVRRAGDENRCILGCENVATVRVEELRRIAARRGVLIQTAVQCLDCSNVADSERIDINSISAQ